MKKEIIKCSLCEEIIKEYSACFTTSNIDGNKQHFHDKCFKQNQYEIKEEWEKIKKTLEESGIDTKNVAYVPLMPIPTPFPRKFIILVYYKTNK